MPEDDATLEFLQRQWHSHASRIARYEGKLLRNLNRWRVEAIRMRPTMLSVLKVNLSKSSERYVLLTK
jgi:hypothetical protein